MGRETGCDTLLIGSEVSRRHAELRKSGPLCVVRDLGSKNGLFVNAERVEQAVLSVGDVVRVGEWLGVVTQGAQSADCRVRDLGAGIWGGPELATAVERARMAAKSELPVALVGETGTGKERFASALHAFSDRRGPFLAVNCSTYTAELAASELFGHRQGAFTGAQRTRVGHVQTAEGGTLFLDEVADLPLAVRPQLLRVLEQREVLRLGESRPEPVDVRFVCASQVPLAKLVDEGRFRADLRARLEGVVLHLPPLRQRRGDIPGLFGRLLRLALERANTAPGEGATPRLEPRLMERLCIYEWPLNVRELGLVVQRLLTLLPQHDTWRLSDVEAVMPELAASKGAASAERSSDRPSGERRDPRAYTSDELAALSAALERHRGNVTRAAEELGITRQKAYRMLEASKVGGR